MTHTLETTGDRPRRRARAAAERGPDRGDRPWPRHGPPAVRPCGRGGARRVRCASGSDAGSATTSSRFAIAERLNLTWEVRDGILKHTGPDEPETLEGRIVRIVDRVAYINHDIDDAIRFGILRADELPRESSTSSGPPVRSGSTRSCTTSSRAPRAPATSSRARRSAARCSPFVPSCSSASTSARTRAREHDARARGRAHVFEHLVRARRRGRRDRRLSLRHDRPVRARLRGEL